MRLIGLDGALNQFMIIDSLSKKHQDVFSGQPGVSGSTMRVVEPLVSEKPRALLRAAGRRAGLGLPRSERLGRSEGGCCLSAHPTCDRADAGWSVIPPLSGNSHTLQTVWNSLRQENRLTVIFQVLFSRSFVKNKVGHVGMLKTPVACSSTTFPVK